MQRLGVTAGLAAAFCLVMAASATHANMTVDRSIIYFDPGDPERVDVTVNNPGSEPLYVETEILEVRSPGTAEEQRVPVPGDLAAALLVSPNKMVIAPGRKKLLRVVNLAGHVETEQVFRVNVKPVPPPATAASSGIRVFVAYQLLIIISPANPKPDLQSRRVGDRLVFENRGNTNFLLHSGRQCPPDIDGAIHPEQCTAFEGTRLYPGNLWSVEIPFETPVEFTVTASERNSRRQF